ncbi:MAG: GNAT family N-acetyltransferase [Chloroflexi bacterium]|nr:GNAT family N-acetyltransferase [Chloroflexota bacterium]
MQRAIVNKDEFEIQTATRRDLETLIDALGPEVGAGQIRKRFEDSVSGERIMLVAVKEGRAVGTVSIGGNRFRRRGSLRLFALDVGTDSRRKGVGTALVNAVEEIATRGDLNEVNLEVGIDNEDAIRLYLRLGYQISGDVVMDQWTKLDDDGSSETIEEPVFVMVKKLP